MRGGISPNWQQLGAKTKFKAVISPPFPWNNPRSTGVTSFNFGARKPESLLSYANKKPAYAGPLTLH